jgi:RNA polymerase sigma-70 factor (ECF subfamily)
MASAQVTTAYRDRCFVTTQWSVVLTARDGVSPESREALDELCRTYWYPLYGYIRRRGYTHEDARDLTQEFFLRLNTPNFLASVSGEKGKFRSFLLASLNHFLANEWHSARAEKRGGGAPHVPVEPDTYEDRYLAEMATDERPEMYFDKKWALTILERALNALREESATSGKSASFDLLKSYLTDVSAGRDYTEAAAQLQMKPNAVAVAVHRLRARYRELVRAGVAQTVESEADLESEMNYLLSVLSR